MTLIIQAHFLILAAFDTPVAVQPKQMRIFIDLMPFHSGSIALHESTPKALHKSPQDANPFMCNTFGINVFLTMRPTLWIPFGERCERCFIDPCAANTTRLVCRFRHLTGCIAGYRAIGRAGINRSASWMKPYATVDSWDAIQYQRCPALAAVECHVLRYIGGKSKEVGRASDVR